MKQYLDLLAYPIMIGVVYVLFGLVNWQSNPEYWTYTDRAIWLVWGLAWGWALQWRIKWEE